MASATQDFREPQSHRRPSRPAEPLACVSLLSPRARHSSGAEGARGDPASPSLTLQSPTRLLLVPQDLHRAREAAATHRRFSTAAPPPYLHGSIAAAALISSCLFSHHCRWARDPRPLLRPPCRVPGPRPAAHADRACAPGPGSPRWHARHLLWRSARPPDLCSTPLALADAPTDGDRDRCAAE
ncbi:hypothetical protein NDU88_003910 [Pleurodeles waltl]|uniref:Uncharacterized protein n=1 Tax=Pleurodeles waltl TaxID=8319 RepID=A0AAV7W6X4_PLEWA|nr:hypothetical protein NDU88_003910 [Pleurodeles waltl]